MKYLCKLSDLYVVHYRVHFIMRKAYGRNIELWVKQHMCLILSPSCEMQLKMHGHFNSLSSSDDLCHLLLSFANSLDPDQA